MRFYNALLLLDPASFRAEYRDELRETFAERARELSGLLAPLWIVLAHPGLRAHRGAATGSFTRRPAIGTDISSP